MTEPTYEVNQEALSKLSIADLTGLYQIYTAVQPTYNERFYIISKIVSDELDIRINDIIIF